MELWSDFLEGASLLHAPDRTKETEYGISVYLRGAAECAWGKTFGGLRPSLGYAVSCRHKGQRLCDQRMNLLRSYLWEQDPEGVNDSELLAWVWATSR